jgi:hypothetical protein
MRSWLLWLALTVVAWGATLLLAVHQPWQMTPRPAWLLQLEFTVFPVVGVASLAAPVLAAVALVLKRWVRPALILLGVIAAAQAAAALAEFSVKPAPMPYFEIHKG